MTLFIDTMPYFDEFIHVYGWNMSILWSPLKIWTPKNFTTANFRHPVYKSWLRHLCIPFRVKQFGTSTDTSRMVSCISMVLLMILKNIPFLLHIHKVSRYGSLATPNNVTFWQKYFSLLFKLEKYIFIKSEKFKYLAKEDAFLSVGVPVG